MTVRKGGLGRGLDAMISETASKPRTTATATKKTVAPKEKKENSVLKVKLTQVELYWNWQSLLNSLVFYSHCW